MSFFLDSGWIKGILFIYSIQFFLIFEIVEFLLIGTAFNNVGKSNIFNFYLFLLLFNKIILSDA